MKDTSIKSVLIIGSGPIVIGQACEFDYSGSQSANSLREEGIEVTLINSNPATIMTDKVTADHIYLLPLEVKSIIKILEERQIDAVLPTMGGQTALNLALKCDDLGIWKKYNVKMIGVDIDAIKVTEDRDLFRIRMNEIGVAMAPSKIAKSFLEGKSVAQEFGFPLVIRPSFTLGGSGGSVVGTRCTWCCYYAVYTGLRTRKAGACRRPLCWHIDLRRIHERRCQIDYFQIGARSCSPCSRYRVNHSRTIWQCVHTRALHFSSNMHDDA